MCATTTNKPVTGGVVCKSKDQRITDQLDTLRMNTLVYVQIMLHYLHH